MSIDRATLARLLADHGPIVRVVVAAVQGSAPREEGAAMAVWDGGQAGTIGGGALEFDAADQARALLAAGQGAAAWRRPLGPALGQCCGGAVTLVAERVDDAWLAALPETGPYARRIEGAAEPPLAIRRALVAARGKGWTETTWAQGWLAEPVAPPARDLWIWGAGHVGRALVAVLAPLPGFRITWVDTAPNRFPPDCPDGVAQLVATDPGAVATRAPRDADHLILTYSHAIDLDLCHRLLAHGFGSCGLIGSASKWARFRARLAALGHGSAEISRISCPIGDPALGKHPQAIAVGVAAGLLKGHAAVTEGRIRAG